jgi:hypothetical protein
MTSTNPSENVSALKAKYTDYAMWLKASARQNREPVFTHELLKHSLCEMGIDSTQAEQLVSTCSWYVYQFQKELGADNDQTDQSVTTEIKKSQQPTKKRQKKIRRIKPKKTIPQREHSAESTTTITSLNKGFIYNKKTTINNSFYFILENLNSSGSSSPIRNKFTVLPAIQSTDTMISPRSRRVDFDNEQFVTKPKPSHWKSAVSKVRTLPKLRPTEIESSINDHPDIITPGSTPVDFDLSISQRTLPRNGTNTRSILRKQTSSCSSVASTDYSYRKTRSRLLTPASTIIDEIPLGTRSQRLFGGSECFAEIMNELEEQK